jgi:hypothetical protein
LSCFFFFVTPPRGERISGLKENEERREGVHSTLTYIYWWVEERRGSTWGGLEGLKERVLWIIIQTLFFFEDLHPLPHTLPQFHSRIGTPAIYSIINRFTTFNISFIVVHFLLPVSPLPLPLPLPLPASPSCVAFNRFFL